MNLGIADAAELAARMVEGRLDGYGESRRAVGASTIAVSERARRLVTSTSFVRRTVTLATFRAINKMPRLQRQIARRFLSG